MEKIPEIKESVMATLMMQKAHNPLCGDKVHIFLKLNKEKEIEDLSFEGRRVCYLFGLSIYFDRNCQRKRSIIPKKVNEDFINMIKNKTKNYTKQPYRGSDYYDYFFIRGPRISNEG